MTSKSFSNAVDVNRQQGGRRNLIINGGQVIDQRNGGASVTPPNGATTYITDRWAVNVNQSSKLTAQQSTVAPSGFTNSLLVTSSSAYSLASTDLFVVSQSIEGYNCANLAWGTSDAKTITISFKVRSSLTGTFGGVIRNSATNRFYPFTYTINSADTFEDKSITIEGDTSGTWLTNNGIGLSVFFALGVGSSYSQTAGAWTSSFALSATGATSLVGTSGATFYITGVQLEVGTVATPFEHRSYGEELALCQRYYYQIAQYQYAGQYTFLIGAVGGSNTHFVVNNPQVMRVAPTVTYSGSVNILANATEITAPTSFLAYSGSKYVRIQWARGTLSAGDAAWVDIDDGKFTFDSEL